MKEWICREMSTSTSGNENGVLMMETELIRCKDCVHYTGLTDSAAWGRCHLHGKTCQDCDYCSWAERKEE